MAPDNRWLVRRRQTWFVVVEVPPSLRTKLGRRIKRTLRTRDINVARARRFAALAAIRTQIEAARKGQQGDPITQEALAFREALLEARNSTEDVSADPDDPEPWRAYEASPENVIGDQIVDRAEAIERGGGYSRAKAFADLAFGRVTPLDLHVEAWLAEAGIKGSLTERTKLERRRAVKRLAAWLEKEQLGATIEAVNRRAAGRFVSEHLIPSGKHTATIGKTVHTLSSYWRWLRRRGVVPDDGRIPWAEQAPRSPRYDGQEPDTERAFTDAEVTRLITAAPNETLKEFMLVGALTGLRREEIGRLRVADCSNGVFIVKRGKTAAARRRVPIHSGLTGLVDRRTRDRAPDDYLFHDLRAQGSERTDPIGKSFARHRQSLGIQEGTGRRSTVNFHSLRRWFITTAINAAQPPHLVSLVVGHQEGRKGMTLGRYWNGADDPALRAVVEAVRLPLAGL